MQIWENFISINSEDTSSFEVLPAPAHFHSETERPKSDKMMRHLSAGDISRYANNDTCPLPLTKDREGYHGNNHFDYWLSGLIDFVNLEEIARKQGLKIGSYLGFGCASGRVLRHFAAHAPEVTLYGCDINLRHVRWISKFLGGQVLVFQNTSMPYLPLPDESIDAIGAFSVFTHIECFDTMWLMEMRRILKPGGLAYVTIFSEETFRLLDETWPAYKPVVNHPKFRT